MRRPTPRDSLLRAALLVVAIVLAYTSSFRGVFLGDDIDGIVDNPHVRSLSLSAFRAPVDTTLAGRPIAAVSFAVSYAMAPLDARDAWAPADPAGSQLLDGEPMARNVRVYHAMNLAIHVCVVLLVFGLVRRSLLAPALGGLFEGRAEWLAFAAALLWGLHPLQTAAVTYIVQRAESLMGLFFLLTLYAAVRAVGEGRRTAAWTAAAIAACALGMATKEVMVVAPILTALWIHVLWQPSAASRRHRRVLMAGLAATWVVLAALVAANPRGESVGLGLGGWTPLTYFLTQASVIVHYLRLAIYPSPLVFTYDWAPAGSWIAVLPHGLLLAGLAGLTLAGLVRRQPLALAGAWFFLILAPSSSVLPIATEVAAEHRMYLPLAAIVTLLVIGADGLLRRWTDGRVRGYTAAVTLIALAVALGTATHARSRDYWSLEAMMRDVIEKQPGSLKARVTLGGHLVSLKRFDEAEHHLRIALELPPLPADPGLSGLAHMYLGSTLAAQGRSTEGILHLERALAIAPALVEAHGLLGEAYASQGRSVDASRAFRRAAEALPDIPLLLNRAARLLATSSDASARDGAAAVRFAERAVDLTSGQDLMALDTLAAAYAESGRFPEAIATVGRALDLARRTGNVNAVAVLEQRLAWYATGRPLRDQ